ncbi:unnamed protein product [Prunus armeniaca]|uniref:Uncharacterized protein n=1 Tax=Prunus armeniaca TaxID=36596 RepID=A0A6J5U338_PRUAR|nr:unnamed protein product [Prunus armeniaca]
MAKLPYWLCKWQSLAFTSQAEVVVLVRYKDGRKETRKLTSLRKETQMGKPYVLGLFRVSSVEWGNWCCLLAPGRLITFPKTSFSSKIPCSCQKPAILSGKICNLIHANCSPAFGWGIHKSIISGGAASSKVVMGWEESGGGIGDINGIGVATTMVVGGWWR